MARTNQPKNYFQFTLEDGKEMTVQSNKELGKTMKLLKLSGYALIGYLVLDQAVNASLYIF